MNHKKESIMHIYKNEIDQLYQLHDQLLNDFKEKLS